MPEPERPGDIRQLLQAGGFHVPDDDRCGQLQAYWDELTAQRREVDGEFGPAEIALTYTAERPEDD